MKKKSIFCCCPPNNGNSDICYSCTTNNVTWNVQVRPDPTNCATTVTLTATTGTGSGNITGAEYFIDTREPMAQEHQ